MLTTLLFLDSELLAALTPGAALPAASCFFRNSTPTSTVTSSSDSSSWYTFTAQSGPSGPLLLMQHSHPTFAFKPLILFPPTSYLLPLHPYHHLMLLTVFLYLLLPLPLFNSLKVLQWNAGGLQARSTNFCNLFRLIRLTLFIYRNLTLIYLPFTDPWILCYAIPWDPLPIWYFFY